MGGGSGGPPKPPPISFAAVTPGASSAKGPRLLPILLSKRPLSYVDNVAAIIFTPIEVEQLNKQR